MSKSLNEQQLKAVQFPLAPIMIMAGAGTGKTTVLTERIVYLICNLEIDPSRILAITFTNKAADEMNVRIQKKLGYSLPWIGTFHKICLSILREEIHHINRKNNFRVIDTEEAKTILKTIYDELEIDKNVLSIKNALNIIEKIKTYNYEIEKLYSFEIKKKFDLTDDVVFNLFLKVYCKYAQKLIDYNYLDFNDILNLVNVIFENNIEVRNRWSNMFDYILVDEFQDTNTTQFKLIEYLSKDCFNVFAVGDEDQIIYSFRGADSEVINKFISKQPKKIEVLKLEENYRSTNQILNVANKLISHNKNRIEKNLFSNKQDDEKPTLQISSSADEEALYVARKIQKLLNEGYELKDFAILYRSNHISRIYEQALISFGFKYNLYGGFKFYQRSEIKDILAYLQVINNYDEMSLRRIINLPRRKISDATVKIILDYSNAQQISFWDALVEHNDIEELTKLQHNAIQNFIDLIINLKEKNTDDIENFFNFLIKEINYIEYCKSIDSKKVKNIEDNLEELKNSMIQFKNRNNKNWSLTNFLNEIAIYTINEDKKKIENAITLSTIHSSKGLEYRCVFLVSFNDGVFPSNQSILKNDLIEERRLAYVAITRAKERLYVCANRNYNFQTKEKNETSRFLKEIDPELFLKEKRIYKTISDIDQDWFDSLNKPKINIDKQYTNETENNYKIGDRVVHIVFGNGIVIDVKNEILEISFKPPYKIKNIIYNHKSIKRMVE